MSEPTVVVVREPTIVTVTETETTLVLVTAPGPQGAPGVSGIASGVSVVPFASVSATNVQDALEEIIADLPGGDSYMHDQTTAADTWTVTHNFGRVPSDPYVVESTGDTLEPGRDDPDLNTTILDFDGVAVSGAAHFS